MPGRALRDHGRVRVGDVLRHGLRAHVRRTTAADIPLTVSTPALTALPRVAERQRGERAAGDRRRVRLVPTESAATEVRGQLRGLLDRLDALTEEFTEGEREAIHRYLQAATAAYHRFATDDG